MTDLLEEEDYIGLPEGPEHKWIMLEKTARARLFDEIDSDQDPNDRLLFQYMSIVQELASNLGVAGIEIPSGGSNQDRFERFSLAVSRAKNRIWSDSLSSYENGTVKLKPDAKHVILDCLSTIEKEIDSLEVTNRKKAKYRGLLEDFRREINQSNTRIGVALSKLVQVSTIFAMTATGASYSIDAYNKITHVLGAAQAEQFNPEIKLLEEDEKRLLLPSPPKQITGPKDPDVET